MGSELLPWSAPARTEHDQAAALLQQIAYLLFLRNSPWPVPSILSCAASSPRPNFSQCLSTSRSRRQGVATGERGKPFDYSGAGLVAMDSGRSSPLHCWEFPNSASPSPSSPSPSLNCEGVCRPSRPQSGRPHPRCGFVRDRSKVLQRLRGAPTRRPSSATENAAAVRGQPDVATAKVVATPPPPELGEQTQQSPKRALGAAQALANVVLNHDAKNRYYGSLSGVQVEMELNRLGGLVRGLLHDFAAVRPLVNQLEQESRKVQERVDALEQGEIAKLCEALDIADSRILGLVGQAELMEARLTAIEMETPSCISGLSDRINALDLRLTACSGLFDRVNALDIRLIASEDASATAATAMAKAAATAATYPFSMLQLHQATAIESLGCELSSVGTSEVVSPAATPRNLEDVARDCAGRYVDVVRPENCCDTSGLNSITSEFPAEVERVKREFGDAVPICLLGGRTWQGLGCEELIGAIAREFALRFDSDSGAAFVIRGPSYEWQTFAEQIADATRVWSLSPHDAPHENAPNFTFLRGGLDARQRDEILAQLGPVCVVIGDDATDARVARAAHQRGCLVVPVAQSGGAASGLFDLLANGEPRRELESTRGHWAVLADDTSTLQQKACSIAIILRSALASQ